MCHYKIIRSLLLIIILSNFRFPGLTHCHHYRWSTSHALSLSLGHMLSSALEGNDSGLVIYQGMTPPPRAPLLIFYKFEEGEEGLSCSRNSFVLVKRSHYALQNIVEINRLLWNHLDTFQKHLVQKKALISYSQYNQNFVASNSLQINMFNFDSFFSNFSNLKWSLIIRKILIDTIYRNHEGYITLNIKYKKWKFKKL